MSRYTTFVLDINGKPLMPTTNPKKVRNLLKNGKAKIVKYTPFTIQLTYNNPDAKTQPVEIGVDSGYIHIGISVKSEKHEYLSLQADLLDDEKEKHDDKRKYRKTRRNRLRYRPARFNNRKHSKPKGWFATSIKNKIDRHVDLIKGICDICPVGHVTIECGQFDMQVLQAIEEGKPIPQGLDYQHGPKYGFDTLREALFSRDKYTCRVCGKSAIKDNFNDFSEDLLDSQLYLPFTNYYSYWGSICKAKGFILYRPCSNAHMSEYTVLENGHSYRSPIKKKYIFADKVVPIGFITCPIVAHETKDATAEYYEELDKGKIQRIPAFGKPVCFEFGTVFGTELYETHTVKPEKLENNVWHEV